MSNNTAKAVHTCKQCGRKTKLTSRNVKREFITRGYKADYYAYVIRCPYCNNPHETTLFNLPFSIAWEILKKRWFGKS